MDENLPPSLARGLNALFAGEHEVVALRDRYKRAGVTDEEWITDLGAEGGWSVLSGDIRIAKKKPSRALVLQANLVGFFPTKGVLDMPLNRQAARILLVWPQMVQLVGLSGRGVYEIGPTGSKLRQIST